MRFTEENLKNLKLTKNGNFRDYIKNITYHYHYACNECGYPYLSEKNGRYCGYSCANTGENHPMFGKGYLVTGEKNGMFGRTGELNPMFGRTGELSVCFGRTGDKHPMFGTKRPEHSERMKGENNPTKRPEVREKMSKNSASRRPESRERVSKQMKGSLNPRYIDGRSCDNNPYCIVWSDKEWKHYIKHARDKGRCWSPYCNNKHLDKLTLHHINYNKKDCDGENLITLCISCNSRANIDREWHEAYYTALMIKRGYNEY
jgi:hypothetical protein